MPSTMEQTRESRLDRAADRRAAFPERPKETMTVSVWSSEIVNRECHDR